MEVTRIFE